MQILTHNNFLPFDEIVKLNILNKKELYILGKYEAIKIDIEDISIKKTSFKIKKEPWKQCFRFTF